MSTPSNAEIMAALYRIEQRQAAYEVVAHKILTCIEVGNAKTDRLIELLTTEAPPGDAVPVLKDILASMRRQADLLEQVRS